MIKFGYIPDLIFKIKSFGILGDLLELIKNFLSNRSIRFYQTVVLNGQTSEWEKNNAGVPQGPILGPLFFLIYINDLTDGILSILKLFTDDTSSFSVVQNNNLASQLNNDLDKVSDWVYTGKVNLDLKTNTRSDFSRKCTKEDHPPIYFNDIPVTQTTAQKDIALKKSVLKKHILKVVSATFLLVCY